VPSETETPESKVFQISHMSHSSVESYARCGHAFKLAKIEKASSEPSWALVGGSAVHLATETLDLLDFGIDNGGPQTFADAFDAALAEQAERGWTESDIRSTGRKSREWPNARNKDYWLQVGQGHINRWRNFLQTGMDIAIIAGKPAVEIEFLVDLVDEVTGEIVPFKGYIDRVLESPIYGLGVVDLKTGAGIPESENQLREYVLALGLVQADEPIQWAAYYMTQEEKGGLTPPVALSSRTDAQVKAPIVTAWRGIKAGIFMPNVGRHCTSCFVRDHCEFF
jgi:hypothetical protein